MGAGALLLVDELVVEVLQVDDVEDHVQLVVGLLDGEGVALHVEHLQVLDLGALAEGAQDGLEVLQLVVADREHVQVHQRLQLLHLGDLVVVQRQVRDLHQTLQPSDVLDAVERQVYSYSLPSQRRFTKWSRFSTRSIRLLSSYSLFSRDSPSKF